MSPDFNFYIVGLLDLLGQSEKLGEITEQLILSGDRQTILAKIRPTVGRAKGFREQIRDMVGQCNVPLTMPNNLQGRMTPEDFEKFTGANVAVEFMSDSALLKVCLGDKKILPLSSIRNMLDALSMTFLSFLAGGLSLRGSVEFGWGTEIETNSIYGTMLPRVFRLEKDAGYPRIVIGSVFNDYIADIATVKQNGVSEQEADFLLEAAQDIKTTILEDDDGKIVLNYLNRERFKGNEGPFDDCVKDAKKFIEGEILNRKRIGPPNVYNKYCLLRRFFEKCGYW